MKVSFIFLVLFVSAYSQAINIFGKYIEPGNTIHGVQSMAGPTMSGGGSLTAIFDQAALAWNSRIGDDWSIEISYGWSNTIGSALAQYTGWWFPFGDMRHLYGRVLFNPNYSWFADATPTDHSEYLNYQETFKDFGSGSMNIGRKYTSATGAAAGKFDLLSVATHEIGHSLNIGVGMRWANEVTDSDIDVTDPRRYSGAHVPVDMSQAHLADPTAVMWYGTAAGERKLLTELDVEAGMQLSGFNIQTVPEPTGVVALFAGLALLVRRRIRN